MKDEEVDEHGSSDKQKLSLTRCRPQVPPHAPEQVKGVYIVPNRFRL